jgi:succinyl-CoA synthetase alpha subunit
MRLSQQMEGWQEVVQATAIMGTPSNLALLDQAGLLTGGPETIGPNDLVIALQISMPDSLESLETRARELLTAAAGVGDAEDEYRPRTLDGALKALPNANLAVVSVPGQYAAYEARKALDRGLNVLVFSDNVSLDEEIELKRRALELGLFMLGPDCGTAIIDGVPLGFANVVPLGSIGLVSASGTGLQQITCLIGGAGGGVSQALGVGGRDLEDGVGGAMMLKGLRALDDDPETAVIVLVSKPPGPATAEKVFAALKHCTKPSVVCFLGAEGGPSAASLMASKVFVEPTLEGAASKALALAGVPGGQAIVPGPPADLLERLDAGLGEGGRCIRGFYSGGTLCYEALLVLRGQSEEVRSNLRLAGVLPIEDGEKHAGHLLLDLGHEQLTVGRPHPMIDLGPRCRRLAQAAQDPDVGILLLDVVLGYGAHPDPASQLAPAILKAQRLASGDGRALACVIALIGTAGDPQDLDKQRAALAAVGAVVVSSNLQAATIAAGLSHGPTEPVLSLPKGSH